jgi:protein CpxP
MSTIIKRAAIGLAAVIGFSMLFSISTQAQPMGMSTEKRVKMLKDTLNLTDDQAAKITVIFNQQREEISAAFQKYSDDRDSMRTAMQGIMQKYDKKIDAILTKKQVTQYNVMREERRKRMGMRMQ